MVQWQGFIADPVIAALEECPFSARRQIAKRTFIAMSMVQYHLVNSLGYRIRKIRWVLHSLSSSQKQAPVAMSQNLFQVLRLTKHHAWK
jgi:hypothetical protein